jgi:hypothetical protein
MSISVWTQLFRNFFCVLKSVVPQENFIQKPLFADSSFYPLTLTSSIELLIAPTQFAAVILNFLSGFTAILNGKNDLDVANDWLSVLDRVLLSSGLELPGVAYLIVRQGLESDIAASKRKMFIGVLELIFGFAFIFLVLNSLHIVGPSHPKPLVDAVLSMEIGLAYILLIMWQSFTEKAKDSSRSKRLAAFIRGSRGQPLGTLLVGAIDSGFKGDDLFRALSLFEAYKPLWRNKNPKQFVNKKITKNARIESEVRIELINVTVVLNKLSAMDVKGSDIHAANRIKLALVLDRQAYVGSLQAPIELLYFILNFVAGYGYLLGILAFYIPEVTHKVPLGVSNLIANIITGDYSWCKVLMFGMTHGDADWWGNLAGDFAWTLEPIIIIVSKPVLTYLVDLKFSTDFSSSASINSSKKIKSL